MRNYKISLDISNVYPQIKHLHLKGYNSPFPTIFICSSNPDEACGDVIKNLIKLLLDQDSTITMRLICRKLHREFRIIKIYPL